MRTMRMAGESIPAFLALTPTLVPELRCECCGVSSVDGVTHLLVAEAVLAGLRATDARIAEERAAVQSAWDEAEAALAAAQAGH